MPIHDPPPRIPLRERASCVFVERGRIDVRDGAFVVVDKNGERVQIPIGGLASLMLEPGTRVSHAAVRLAAQVGCLLVWLGEGGVRVYSAGRPGGARADRLLYQARLALDESARLQVVRKMFEIRFGEPAPARRSVDQLRGVEGARVRAMYKHLAARHGVRWVRRDYDPANWDAGDLPNRCLSAATAALYGVTEAAVLAAGYSPAIGFIHTGKPLSFVYDIADLIKFETVVPTAFAIAARPRGPDVERQVRVACRDAFRKKKVLSRLIPLIDEVLSAGGLDPPAALKPGQVGPALPARPHDP